MQIESGSIVDHLIKSFAMQDETTLRTPTHVQCSRKFGYCHLHGLNLVFLQCSYGRLGHWKEARVTLSTAKGGGVRLLSTSIASQHMNFVLKDVSLAKLNRMLSQLEYEIKEAVTQDILLISLRLGDEDVMERQIHIQMTAH
jgi:hypothetical protein